MSMRKTARSILVSAGIIRRKSKNGMQVLIAKRLANAKVEAGKWEFPGGKVEPFEHPEETLVREIREELDLVIKVDEVFDINSHVYERRGAKTHIVLLCYLCTFKSGKIKLLEAADAKWISLREIDQYDFAAADHRFVKLLRTTMIF